MDVFWSSLVLAVVAFLAGQWTQRRLDRDEHERVKRWARRVASDVEELRQREADRETVELFLEQELRR